MSDSITRRLKIFNGTSDPETLHCNKCDQDKPLHAFSLIKPQSFFRSRYTYDCKQCHNKITREGYNYERSRDYQLWRSYNGFTLADYNAMLEAQGGVCACCGEIEKHVPPGRTNLTKNRLPVFAVDHDHTTGEVRALLCYACNTAVGMMEERPERALQLHAYLLKIRKNK